MTRTIATLAAAIALAVPAGIGAAAIVTPGVPPAEPASRVVHAGGAVLAVPSGWERAAPVLGLQPDRTAVLAPSPGLAARAVVTLGPADDRSLLPADLRAAVDGPLPQPRRSTLGGHPAVVYRGLTAGDLLLDATVLPSTGGMLAVACAAPADSGYYRSECASSVASASVPGATALAPSPAIPLASHLPAAIARLDRATVAGRADLGRARTPSAQADAAARLADRQRDAAGALRAAFGGPSRRVAAALERSASGYEALSDAATAGSAGAFAAARRTVRGAEVSLATAVGDVLSDGTRPSTPAPPTTPAAPTTAGDPAWHRLAEALLVTLLLLGSLTAGFMTGGPAGGLARTLRRRSAPT
jgi:hypothetical protein